MVPFVSIEWDGLPAGSRQGFTYPDHSRERDFNRTIVFWT